MHCFLDIIPLMRSSHKCPGCTVYLYPVLVTLDWSQIRNVAFTVQTDILFKPHTLLQIWSWEFYIMYQFYRNMATFAASTKLKAFVRIIGVQRRSYPECRKQGFVIPTAIEQSPGLVHIDASIQAEQRMVRLAVPRSHSWHVEERWYNPHWSRFVLGGL